MLIVKIHTGNAAFVDNRVEELCDILSSLQHQLRDGKTSGKLFDVNGNSVGKWKLS